MIDFFLLVLPSYSSSFPSLFLLKLYNRRGIIIEEREREKKSLRDFNQLAGLVTGYFVGHEWIVSQFHCYKKRFALIERGYPLYYNSIFCVSVQHFLLRFCQGPLTHIPQYAGRARRQIRFRVMSA